MQHHPGKLAIGYEDVGAAAEESVRDVRFSEQAHDFGNRVVAAEKQLVRGAANAERSVIRERYARAHFDAQFLEARGE